jgi:hypothetical protein
MLVGAVLPDGLSADLRTCYAAACTALLRRVGLAAADGTWPTLIASAVAAFSDMLHVLSAAALVHPFMSPSPTPLTGRQVDPLSALLRLLGDLCFALPDLAAAMLVTKGLGVEDSAPRVVASLVTIVQSVPETIKLDAKASQPVLEAFMGLLEGLTWDVSDDLAEK